MGVRLESTARSVISGGSIDLGEQTGGLLGGDRSRHGLADVVPEVPRHHARVGARYLVRDEGLRGQGRELDGVVGWRRQLQLEQVL